MVRVFENDKYQVTMKRILFVGSGVDNHLLRLIKYVKSYDIKNNIQIDLLDVWGNTATPCPEVDNFYIYKHYFPKILYRPKIIHETLHKIDIKFMLYQLKGNYDIVNIHYLTCFSYHAMPFFKNHSRYVLATPWGSDIYRICPKDKKKIKYILDMSNRISSPRVRFRYDIEKLFDICDEKFIDLAIGSETIDSILEYKESKDNAKESLGLGGCYVITCGYNRVTQQNHKRIIESIGSIGKDLPQNSILLFPFTYGGCPDNYKEELVQLLEKYNLKYRFIEKYLTNEKNSMLRYASDLFIHFQTTDANSATIHEHILAGTIVFNGEWLRYPTTESFGGTPYISFADESDLATKILKVIKGELRIEITEACKDFIASSSWKSRGKQWYDFFINL